MKAEGETQISLISDAGDIAMTLDCTTKAGYYPKSSAIKYAPDAEKILAIFNKDID